MKKKKKISSVTSYLKDRQREIAKEQGYYDGRFAPKSIPDKKKKADKEACKNWKYE